MNSDKKIARVAGFLYLIVVVSGIFSLMYVPSQLIVWSDAAETVKNIKASELLFRFGIVSSLICYTAFLLLPLVLYKLLKQVDKTWAVLMVALAVVSVPISYFNLVNKVNVLTLLSGADYLKIFGAEQLQAQVMLSLETYSSGILIVGVFWGLWLFPFGYLVYKSGFLPKILGIFLMAGCFGFLIDFSGNFLFPNYQETIIPTLVGLPASFGEIGICLWLLIRGVSVSRDLE